MYRQKQIKHKTVRHYDDPGHCRELTFSCYRQMPLLETDSRRSMLSLAIDRAGERHGWSLTAFVYMPNHVHLLVYPEHNASTIDQLLRAIKRPFSYRVKQQLATSNSSLLQDLTVRQRPGVTTFRFWQEGPGYDRNLSSEKAVLSAIDYIHLNPVRRGLCERAADWRWSNSRWYESDGSHRDPMLPKLTALPANFFVGTTDATPY